MNPTFAGRHLIPRLWDDIASCREGRRNRSNSQVDRIVVGSDGQHRENSYQVCGVL